MEEKVLAYQWLDHAVVRDAKAHESDFLTLHRMPCRCRVTVLKRRAIYIRARGCSRRHDEWGGVAPVYANG